MTFVKTDVVIKRVAPVMSTESNGNNTLNKITTETYMETERSNKLSDGRFQS